jgi:hypothetical protein
MRSNGIGMTVLPLMLAGISGAQTAHRVMVYVRQDNYTVSGLGRAEETAKRILAGAAIELVFRSGSKPQSVSTDAISIEVQLEGRAPEQFHPGAMGYATPYGTSGTRIHILCDRVLHAAPDVRNGAILGYVLAHEIGHVLQGVARHSAAGLMKAHWEPEDYRLMSSGMLPFDSTDIELMRAALEKRRVLLLASGPEAQR